MANNRTTARNAGVDSALFSLQPGAQVVGDSRSYSMALEAGETNSWIGQFAKAIRERIAMVLSILVIVFGAGIVGSWMILPLLAGFPQTDVLKEDIQEKSTRKTLRRVQDLIVNDYVPDMRGVLSTSPSRSIREGLPGPDPAQLKPENRNQSPQLRFLFVNPSRNDSRSGFDPVLKRGWLAPYLLVEMWGTYPEVNSPAFAERGFDRSYGEPDDPTVLDAWGNPIVIQTPDDTLKTAVVVSAGKDGSLLTTQDNLSLPLW